MHFSDALTTKAEATSSIVVGIDPNFDLMPEEFLPNDINGKDIEKLLISFCKSIIDASFDLVPAVKFQSAYFEQYGIAGLKALASSVTYAKSKGLLVILDAKRGDIGSTSEAYAKAYLAGKTELKNGTTVSSGLEVDCMTINPFLGEDSIMPFIKIANKYNKGLFVLVKTSNPDSKMFMDISVKGHTVSERLAQMVDTLGKDSIGNSGFSCIGAVVGATYPGEAANLRALMPNAIFLAPGVGVQGGTIETALACFHSNRKGAIVPISRGITYPTKEDISEKGFVLSVRDNVFKYINLFK